MDFASLYDVFERDIACFAEMRRYDPNNVNRSAVTTVTKTNNENHLNKDDRNDQINNDIISPNNSNASNVNTSPSILAPVLEEMQQTNTVDNTTIVIPDEEVVPNSKQAFDAFCDKCVSSINTLKLEEDPNKGREKFVELLKEFTEFLNEEPPKKKRRTDNDES